VSRKESLTTIGQLVPELPVTDVERAQQHYRIHSALRSAGSMRARWGRVAWKVAIFFRKRKRPFEAAVHWVFAEDIDATYNELKSLGANIVDPWKKALGAKAVHRRGHRRKPFLFSPRLNRGLGTWLESRFVGK